METPRSDLVRDADDTAEGEFTLRLSNPAGENGYDQDPGPLTWLNSARLVADPESDSVACYISVGDPRGAFAFTVTRCEDGRLLIHVPHMGKRWLRPGTLIIGHGGPDEATFTASDFSDPAPFERETKDLTRDQCVQLLLSAGIQCYDKEDADTLREAVRVNLEDGTLTTEDVDAAERDR